MAFDPANFSIVRLSGLRSSPEMVAAVRAGIPAALSDGCGRGSSGGVPLPRWFSISTETVWVGDGQYEPREIVLVPRWEKFVVANADLPGIMAWLDVAVPGYAENVDGNGFPVVKISPLEKDGEFLGLKLAAWLDRAEKQSDIEERM